MKHLLLYYLIGTLSTGAVNAGVAECHKHAAQKPIGTDTLSLTTALSTIITALSSVTSSITLTPTTLSTITISSLAATPIHTTPTSTAAKNTGPTSQSSLVPLSDYLPIFYDDFSGTPGSLPSSANWIFDTGTSYPGSVPNWGNHEKETYSTSTSNLQITASSTLLITPLWSASQGWTSARIETQRSDFQCPEKRKLFIQASIKLGNDPASSQQGIWPAFWALGSPYRGNYNNWPRVGEWDIMESQNGLAYTAMTIHCGTDPNGPCNEPNGISSSTGMARGVWNTVGFEVDRTAESWQSETFGWYLNGELAFMVNGTRVGDEDAWRMLAYESHFLLLDVAVGGNVVVGGSANGGGNTPTNETIGGEGSGMEVDYVGVWISPP